MFKKLSILLLCLPLLGFGIIPISGRRDPAAGGAEFSDDFSGTLTNWTHLAGSGWSIVLGELRTNDTAGVLLYTDEQTNTISQYVAVEKTQDTAYCGPYLRSTNNASEYAYAIRWMLDNSVIWRYCTGSSCTTIESGSTVSIATGDCLGAEITGTGNDTVVKLWDLGATCTDHSTWGTADETFTNNPANAADTGKYIGLYNGSSGDCGMDNFAAGDI